MKKLFFLLIFNILFSATSLSANTETADELFNAVLKEHVTEQGFVDYLSIQQDTRFLDYLLYLEQAKPSEFNTDHEKLAFWINAYNALAIKGILNGQSPNGFFKRIGYFKTKKYKLAGQEITLYDLEHKVILPFKEPRIHFSIVCASASCPILRNEIYRAQTLEQQLEENAFRFINDPDKNRFNSDKQTASISKIFDWFKEDFIQAEGSVLKYITKYIQDQNIAASLSEKEFRIDYLKYDWSLNGKAPNPVKEK